MAVATAAWAFARSFGAIWGAAIPSAVFNSRFDELLYRIDDATLRELLARGGAYEHATRTFITQLDSQPLLKEQVLGVYTEALRRVWTVLIPFAVVPIPLAIFMREVALRKELKTDFGLEEKSDAAGALSEDRTLARGIAPALEDATQVAEPAGSKEEPVPSQVRSST